LTRNCARQKSELALSGGTGNWSGEAGEFPRGWAPDQWQRRFSATSRQRNFWYFWLQKDI